MHAIAATLAVSAAAACLVTGPQAKAQIVYPWCTSGAGHEFGAVNCGFTTFEQCMATARGNGQSCGPNPFYAPSTSSPVTGQTRRRKSPSR